MDYLLFIGWLLLLGWVLVKVPFIRKSGLSPGWVVFFYLLKVAGGVFYGWLTQSDPSTDTWRYHADGLLEYRLLFNDPAAYFTNLFYSGYPDGYGGLLRAQDSYWNDLRANLMIKFVSVLDIFSGGRYYVNVVWYNFLVFFGFTALFRFLKSVLKTGNAVVAVAVCCLPSVWLYGSALHKEGLLLASLGCFLYGFQGWLQNRCIRSWGWMLPSVLLIFLFRPYMVAALVPALAAFGVTRLYKQQPPLRIFAMVYAVCILFFFGTPLIIPSLDFPAIVAQKQAAFLALEPAHTTLPATALQPTVIGFVSQLPAAVQHVLLRPWITDFRMSLQLIPHILEWGAYFLLLLLWWRFRRKEPVAGSEFICLLVFFTASVWLFIGYTVPVLGAIIRYRALYLPLILAPVLAQTDWKSLVRRLNIIKK